MVSFSTFSNFVLLVFSCILNVFRIDQYSAANQKMVSNFKLTRGIIWIYFRLINFLFIPLYLIRKLKTKRKCTPITNDILYLNASELAEEIRTGKLSSETVVTAYIDRIKEVNPLINAVIDQRFEEAISEAKDVDYILKTTNQSQQELKSKFPLLGVPLTVKGSIDLAGLRNTSGVLSRRDVAPAKEDADAVKLAREAGAIPLLTSNVPELCLNWETSNKLQGITKNPYDLTRTVGGSSGGECSLMGAGASLIGIGSDIAGSLRLPAHFCGTWGHKPSPGLVSFKGHYPSCLHEELWEQAFSLGPLARYASDLKLLLHTIAKPNVRDSFNLDKPVDISQIKVYYLEKIDSPLIEAPSNDVKSAMNKVVAHFNLITKINCTKLNMPLMNYAGELSYMKLLDIDDIDNMFDNKGNGSIKALLRYLTFTSKMTLTSISYGIIRKYSDILVKRHMKIVNMKVDKLRDDLKDLLKDDGVLICPTAPSEGHYHGDIYRKLFNPSYCSVFNALGFPVTNCPVLRTSEGLPIGVQVAALPNCDRLTLAVAEEIEKVFGGWQPPSK